MPIYEGRTPGTWRVSVYAHKRRRERIIPADHPDPRQVEAELLLSLGGSPSRTHAPSVYDFCMGEYRQHAELHLGADTWKRVRSYQVSALAAFFGETPLSALTDAQVEAYQRREVARGVKPSTVNHDMQTLRALLAFARERGHTVAPLKIRDLAVPQGRVRVWTQAEVERLLERARTDCPALASMCVFLVNTGCRKGESIAARWSWVDERARLLRIPATDAWHPKSKKAREVPLSTSLLAELRSLTRRGPWLFPRAPDGRRRRCFPKDQFAELRKAVGLDGGPHTLRHTYASLFLQARPDLHLLARILGHSTTRVTELYAHLLPGHLEQARNAVDFGATVARYGGKRASAR